MEAFTFKVIEMELWISLLGFCCGFHRPSLIFPYLLAFLNAFFTTNPLLPALLLLSASPPNALPSPRFRTQYRLNVADRLADEHVLIGMYVSMLRSSPSWLVRVCLPDHPLRGQSGLLTPSLNARQSHWVPEVSLRHFLIQWKHLLWC